MGRAFAFVLVLLATLSSPARAEPAQLSLHACTVGKARLPAHCGTLRVFENRASRAGRTILLHFIEIDAVHRAHRAIFFNPGGPGGDNLSAVPSIAGGFFEKELLTLHDRYDLVFIDNRGTGLSHPINCDLYPAEHPEYYYRQDFPDVPLRTCRAARARDTDLNMYTTDFSADDLEDVRANLHYPKIVLDGGSYGTMFFLDYARRHPVHVESLVLSGVAPPGVMLIPLDAAPGARIAISGLIADCAADHLCHERFPRFGAHFAALVKRFAFGTLELHVRNAVTRRVERVALSREVFADSLRHALYADEGAAYVPYIVERAYAYDYAPLSRLIEVTTTGFGRDLAMGLNLSVTCAEDIPFISEPEIARTSAGSFLGDTRVRAQQHACAIWNVRPVAPAFAWPVSSTAPVLMISGSDDPATPPQYGREALRYLPNGRQIVIPHASHDSESDCTDALIVSFVLSRDAKHLDASKCVGSSRRPPFATSMNGFGS
jgi:pimeloyl-ACP methyl ester carboxylesterase